MARELPALITSLLVGLTSAGAAQEMAAPDEKLVNSAEWQRIQDTWEEAREVALGRRGGYPYSRAEQKALEERVGAAVVDLDSLQIRGLLSGAECALLHDALDDLCERAMSFRVKEDRGWTCYAMSGPLGPPPSMQRLERRIPILDLLAKQERVRPQVLARVLGNITRDLNAFAQGRNWIAMRRVPPETRAKLEQQVSTAVRRLLPTNTEPPAALAGDARWQSIVAACEAAHPWQRRVTGAARADNADERLNAVDRQLATAREAASLLALEGKLDLTELRLLHAELERLRMAVDGNRFRGQPFWLFSTDSTYPAEPGAIYLSWAVPLVLELAREKELRDEFRPLLKVAFRAAIEDLGHTDEPESWFACEHPGFPGLEEKTRAAIAELFP